MIASIPSHGLSIYRARQRCLLGRAPGGWMPAFYLPGFVRPPCSALSGGFGWWRPLSHRSCAPALPVQPVAGPVPTPQRIRSCSGYGFRIVDIVHQRRRMAQRAPLFDPRAAKAADERRQLPAPSRDWIKIHWVQDRYRIRQRRHVSESVQGRSDGLHRRIHQYHVLSAPVGGK